MGHAAVMKAGEVQQCISAGTGIAHSEFNNSPSESVHFLQIWLVPARKGVKPDYAQQSFANALTNGLTLACSPDGHNKSIKINQNVELFIGKLAPKGKINHSIQEKRGVWIQLIEGDLTLNENRLSPGDGAAVEDEKELPLSSDTGAHFLLFDLN